MSIEEQATLEIIGTRNEILETANIRASELFGEDNYTILSVHYVLADLSKDGVIQYIGTVEVDKL